MLSLKGETRVFAQKLLDADNNFKKVVKEIIILNLLSLVAFAIFVVFFFDHLTLAKPFFLPFIAILIAVDALIVLFRAYTWHSTQKELIYRNFMGHNRVLQDLANNYQDNILIKSHMEVLLVGCDLNYKDDLKKVLFITKQLKTDFKNKKTDQVTH